MMWYHFLRSIDAGLLLDQLVTVVSGNHVLIFDPTGVHLPPTRQHARRTSMLTSLASIQRYINSQDNFFSRWSLTGLPQQVPSQLGVPP